MMEIRRHHAILNTLALHEVVGDQEIIEDNIAKAAAEAAIKDAAQHQEATQQEENDDDLNTGGRPNASS
jgi:hypothetical protein